MKEINNIPVKGLVVHRERGKVALRFVCQHCNKIIADAAGALIVNDMEETTAIAVHKSCDTALPLGERLPLSGELDTEMAYLLASLNLDDERLTRAKEKAKALADF